MRDYTNWFENLYGETRKPSVRAMRVPRGWASTYQAIDGKIHVWTPGQIVYVHADDFAPLSLAGFTPAQEASVDAPQFRW